MSTLRRTALITTLAALPVAAALPATAGAMPLPTTFARTIVITGTRQHVRVGRFEVATRAQGTRMRVTVHVTATSLAGSQKVILGVAPCTGGTLTSPLCVPKASSVLTVGPKPLRVTRSFLVARPARRSDAVRITLTVGSRVSVIPAKTSNIGGGAGTAEILLNGGTWRFHSGTFWGMAAAPPAGFTVDRVWFNSRRYEWGGVSDAGSQVTTRFGYEGVPPRWTFVNTMRPGVPAAFHRTPSTPIQERRTAPRAFAYTADVPAGRLFTVRLPLPAYAGS